MLNINGIRLDADHIKVLLLLYRAKVEKSYEEVVYDDIFRLFRDYIHTDSILRYLVRNGLIREIVYVPFKFFSLTKKGYEYAQIIEDYIKGLIERSKQR